MKKFHFIVVAFAFVINSSAWAHGYISDPPSRARLCQLGKNSNCGNVQYEPQSLECASGFPNGGPGDGQIASACLANGSRPDFGSLDEQTSSRWTKIDMTAGQRNFSWAYAARHATQGWRYYITKQNWNPNQKLTRDSFDLTPFCTISGNGNLPNAGTPHSCNVPNRTGYHVILSVWQVADTTNSFYHLIDVNFKNSITPATWVATGTSIMPSADLAVGDQVSTRVFDSNGAERFDLKSTINIASDADGQRNTWPFNLAKTINGHSYVQAGQLGADGNIYPTLVQNNIYVKNGSGLQVQIDIKRKGSPGATLAVSGLRSDYVFDGSGRLSINLNVTVTGSQYVNATITNDRGEIKGFVNATINNMTDALQINMSGLASGRYYLLIKGAVVATGQVIQQTYTLNLSSSNLTMYNYTFPNGMANYQSGTKVLHNGRVYQCKPYPYSGYCVQWSTTSRQFEPGVGSNWQMAWTFVN